MTNFGKTISALVVIIVVAVIVWFVSRKPVIAPSETMGTTQTDTSQTSSSAVTTSSTTDQSLDQDSASIDTQLQDLSTDTSAAATTQ